MEPLFPEIPEDFAALSDEDLQTFIDQTVDAVGRVNAAPADFVSEERPAADLLAEMDASVTAVESARAEQAARLAAVAAETPAEPDVIDVEPVAEEEVDLDAAAAAIAARATAASETEEPEAEVEEEPAEVEPEAEAAVVPAAVPAVVAAAEVPAPLPAAPPVRLAAPARARSAAPADRPAEERAVSLTASAGGLGFDIGQSIDMADVSGMMMRRRKDFGRIAPGTKGDKVPIAMFDWRDVYGEDRVLSEGDGLGNMTKIERVIDPEIIRATFTQRRDGGSLVAAGGLCAPVTPYYGLQMISAAMRPVRASLPSFNADRGGIRAAAPASIASVTTGVGIITAAEDAEGGTFATKTCQVIDCPDFTETDVAAIYHCLQFGNLPARTFPELVSQWNNLVLAAHARLAEATLLTNIRAASTHVTATDQGLGAVGALFGQVLAAADGMRSRHRMDPETVLRAMFPFWAADLMVSDVVRSQFDRFDFNRARATALLRQANIEPTWYLDGAAGGGQVFGAQAAGALLPFPASVQWYLFPEGSFLYLDGGVLELGLVRDSVLNATNDFQIFGETFENVAFIGVESLAVTSTVCDSGTVSAPTAVTCPINYGA
jgi:hypothetical protein